MKKINDGFEKKIETKNGPRFGGQFAIAAEAAWPVPKVEGRYAPSVPRLLRKLPQWRRIKSSGAKCDFPPMLTMVMVMVMIRE